MAEPKVTTSSRQWSQIVSEARASDELDIVLPGEESAAALDARKEVVYEFGGGRRVFKEKQ